MRRLVFAVLLSLAVCQQASAQLSTRYEGGTLICLVRGDGTNDNTWFADAVTRCNAWTGPSVINVSGTIELTTEHNFTGPTSIVGVTPNAQIDFTVTSPNVYLSWNETWDPTDETPFLLDDADAGDDQLSVISGTPPSKGDLIVVWSDDQVPGVEPHNGTGAQQSPETIHYVNEVTSTTLVHLQDFIPFTITDEANAKGAVVPAATLDSGITIDNLILNWSGGGDPTDFSQCMRFTACKNVVVTNRVQMTRTAPGAIAFDYCVDVICNVRIRGIPTADDDGVYGIVMHVVNGAICDNIISGTRHAFTTSSGQNQSTPGGWSTIDAVTTGTPGTITETGHNLSDGNQVRISGTAPGGLAINTNYWVVNSTANTIQLASTPGGAALAITTVGAGSLLADARWGTPMNIVCRGVYYNPPKWATGSLASRTLWDTHAEGYGITCEGIRFVGSALGGTGYFAQTRSVGTKFINCVFESGTGNVIPVRLFADNCEVINCRFYARDAMWRGIQIQENRAGGVKPDNCLIAGNTFNGLVAYCVQVQDGDNHRIIDNTFWDSSDGAGGTPFASESYIAIEEGTGHLVQGNKLRKGTNEHAIDVYQLTTSDITIEGNVMTGYGTGIAGIGRIYAVAAWDDVNDEIDLGFSHGFVDNDQIQFTGSPLPAEVSTGTTYYVILVDQDEIQISTTPGPGAALNFSASATGANAQAGTVDEFEAIAPGLNTVDQ